MFAQALSTPKAKLPPFWWRLQKQYLIFSSKALHSQPLLGAGMAVVTWGNALSPLLCDRASCREHSQQLPIKGNPAKTTPAISWGLSPSQTLALNNTQKPSAHCQGGLQKGWGHGVRTFHLACALSAHSRN